MNDRTLTFDHARVNYGVGQKSLTFHHQWHLSTQGFSVVQGASGCGKTTLLHSIAGLIPLSSGSIQGVDPKKVALLFQEPRLFPWRTLLQHIQDVLHKNMDPMYYLSLVGLEHDAHLKPSHLSGGMARRLSFARTLAYGQRISTPLYLLDEPFTAMDPPRIAQLLPLLQTLPVPVLLATHLPEVTVQATKVFTLSPYSEGNDTPSSHTESL